MENALDFYYDYRSDKFISIEDIKYKNNRDISLLIEELRQYTNQKWALDKNYPYTIEEIDRLNNIINKTRRILGQYAHYSTPTEEQNAKNEAIVDEAYIQLHGNLAKELKEE